MPFPASCERRPWRQGACVEPHENPPLAWRKASSWLRVRPRVSNFLLTMVGAERFELPTPCSQNRCATRLRYAPTPSLPYRKEIPLGKLLVHEFADFPACEGQRTLPKPGYRKLRTRDDERQERGAVPEAVLAGPARSRPKASRRFRSNCPQAIRRARPGSVR